MTNKFFPIFAIVFFCTTINAQNILTKIDSISITDAKIWGGISYDGTSINVTSMIHDNSSTQNHIHLIKFDTSLNQKGNPVQLTTNSDLVMGRGITDHKQLFINNNIYITYSLQQDQELLLFRIDTAGNRIGSLDTVEIGTNNPTNDMIFCTDNNLIHTLHFLPPHRHIINSFDLNLNKVGRDTTSHILAHNNIGEAVYKDSVFHMFTGNFFGHNSELILTEWKTNWDPLSNNAIQTLIPSVNGDGNWFSTAAEFDPVTELWFVGFQHVDQNTSINDEHIDIAVFDKKYKEVLEQSG